MCIISSDKVNIYSVVRPTSVKIYLKKRRRNATLTQDIEKRKNSIRKKYRALEHVYTESDELVRMAYKHILEPLEKISQKLSDAKRYEVYLDVITIPSIKIQKIKKKRT